MNCFDYIDNDHGDYDDDEVVGDDDDKLAPGMCNDAVHRYG